MDGWQAQWRGCKNEIFTHPLPFQKYLWCKCRLRMWAMPPSPHKKKGHTCYSDQIRGRSDWSKSRLVMFTSICQLAPAAGQISAVSCSAVCVSKWLMYFCIWLPTAVMDLYLRSLLLLLARCGNGMGVYRAGQTPAQMFLAVFRHDSSKKLDPSLCRKCVCWFQDV